VAIHLKKESSLQAHPLIILDQLTANEFRRVTQCYTFTTVYVSDGDTLA